MIRTTKSFTGVSQTEQETGHTGKENKIFPIVKSYIINLDFKLAIDSQSQLSIGILFHSFGLATLLYLSHKLETLVNDRQVDICLQQVKNKGFHVAGFYSLYHTALIMQKSI